MIEKLLLKIFLAFLKMDNNEIKSMLEALEEYKYNLEIEFAGHYGKGNHKSLKLTLNGGYKVYNHGVCVLETMQPFAAVERYLQPQSIKPTAK